MPKYSIIVPVYNVKEYLKNCLDSILAQSISDFEVILVNDGSTDGSGQLCDRFAAGEPRIRVIHQQNQGVSIARNTGLASARGEYVLFLDSDDCWTPNLLESLDPVAQKAPDLIEFGYQKVYAIGKCESILPPLPAKGERGAQYLQQLFQAGTMPIGSSCTCAYRRQFLLDHRLSYPVGIRYGEDLKFRLQVLSKAASVYGIPEAFYLYQMRDSSVTHRLTPQSLGDVLSVTAQIGREYPDPVTANYYCMNLLSVASLTRKEASTLKPIYRANRDLMKQATDKRVAISRLLFSILGWYSGAKLIRFIISVRHFLKGSG